MVTTGQYVQVLGEICFQYEYGVNLFSSFGNSIQREGSYFYDCTKLNNHENGKRLREK